MKTLVGRAAAARRRVTRRTVKTLVAVALAAALVVTWSADAGADPIPYMLAALAVGQCSWTAVYGPGPWRATRLGWVWLLKGSMLAAFWAVMWVNEFWDVHRVVFAVLGLGMLVATFAWLRATIHVRFPEGGDE